MDLFMNLKVFPARELLVACSTFVFKPFRLGHFQAMFFICIFRFMCSHMFDKIRTKPNNFLTYVTLVRLKVKSLNFNNVNCAWKEANIIPYTLLHVCRSFWMISRQSYIDYTWVYFHGQIYADRTVRLFEMEFYTHHNNCLDCELNRFYFVLYCEETFLLL